MDGSDRPTLGGGETNEGRGARLLGSSRGGGGARADARERWRGTDGGRSPGAARRRVTVVDEVGDARGERGERRTARTAAGGGKADARAPGRSRGRWGARARGSVAHLVRGAEPVARAVVPQVLAHLARALDAHGARTRAGRARASVRLGASDAASQAAAKRK